MTSRRQAVTIIIGIVPIFCLNPHSQVVVGPLAVGLLAARPQKQKPRLKRKASLNNRCKANSLFQAQVTVPKGRKRLREQAFLAY